MQPLGRGIKEDIERRHEMRVHRELLQKDDFPKFEAGCESFERLLHGFDGNLEHGEQRSLIMAQSTHNASSSGDISTSCPHTSQNHTAETPIADVLDDLKSVLKTHGRCGIVGRAAMGELKRDRHLGWRIK